MYFYYRKRTGELVMWSEKSRVFDSSKLEEVIMNPDDEMRENIKNNVRVIKRNNVVQYEKRPKQKRDETIENLKNRIRNATPLETKQLMLELADLL